MQISASRDRRRDVGGPAPVAPEQPTDQSRVALEQERSGRMRAEQALERAQATLHGLETRLGHAEITQREAVEQARTHQALTTQLQSELSEAASRLNAAQEEATDAQQRLSELRAEMEAMRETYAPEPPPLRPRTVKPAAVRKAPTKNAAATDPGRRAAKRSANPAIDTEEPEPVQWWLIQPPKAKPRRG